MTNREIGKLLGDAILQERLNTNEVLNFINLGLKQRAYLEHGFSSMFAWLTKGFGYSNGSAYRRIQAARMLRSVPKVSKQLENGEVNLTTLCRAQVILNAQEKATGVKLQENQKSEIVELIKNKSEPETERALLMAMPEAASGIKQDIRKSIDAKTVRHAMNLNLKASQNLDRAKELLSHKLHNCSDADVVAYALEYLLKQIDPLQNPAPRTHRDRLNGNKTSKASARRVQIQDSGGACTFQDPVTGKVCGSRYQIQWDHIVPKAMGGSDDPSNRRILCRAHNIFAAEQILGQEKMLVFRKRMD